MATIIIVLGNSDPAIALKRTQRAVEEFHRLPADSYDMEDGSVIQHKYILFSGGKPRNALRSEGEVMMEKCIANGIDQRYLLTELKSRNTVENLLFSRDVLIKLYEKPFDCKPKLVVCTSTFHIRRSIILTKLYLSEYDVRFIHTNEEITPEEAERENTILYTFLMNYTNEQLSL